MAESLGQDRPQVRRRTYTSKSVTKAPFTLLLHFATIRALTAECGGPPNGCHIHPCYPSVLGALMGNGVCRQCPPSILDIIGRSMACNKRQKKLGVNFCASTTAHISTSECPLRRPGRDLAATAANDGFPPILWKNNVLRREVRLLRSMSLHAKQALEQYLRSVRYFVSTALALKCLQPSG